MIEYEDFTIRIESKRGDRYPVRVLRSPAGEGGAEFEPTFNLDELGDLLADLGQTVRGTGLRDAARVVTPGTQPRELGHQLFNALFSGSVRSLLDRSQGMLHGKDRGLRIKLHINPDDPGLAPLASLPWELLYRKETRDFLSLSHSTPVVRYLDIQRPYTPLAIEPPLRILVVVSCPTGYQKLDLDKERELIEQSWAQHAAVEVEFTEKATIRALQDRLATRDVHVLHFMGHGDFDERSGQGVLLMEDSEGSGDLLDGHALGVLLHDARTLRLVVLNACETARVTARQGLDPFAGIATALVLAGIPAVVAMQFPISDGAAITFAERFYPLLAKGRPVDYAMTEARKAIYVAEPGTLEWATPVLFMRSPQGVIFEVREAQVPQVTPAGPPSPSFESHVQPERIVDGEPGRVTVQNLGDRLETFQLTWQDPAQELAFDPTQTELSVPQGQSATVPFRAASRRRRWIGGEKAQPFTAQVTSAAKETQTHSGEVVSKGLVPVWVLPVVIAALALLSLLLNLLVAGPRDGPTVAPTQVAVVGSMAAPGGDSPSTALAVAHEAETATVSPTVRPSPAPTHIPVPSPTPLPTPIAAPTPTVTPAPMPPAIPITDLYAKPDGVSIGKCESWTKACGLQYALSAAGYGDAIWVAAGTYKPTLGDDRSATFQLKSGVELYGGFPATGTPGWDDRNWVAYPTILSGDIGVGEDNSDNSYHVLTGERLTEDTVLDGFTITGGYAVSEGSEHWERKFGGGLYAFNSKLTLKNLRFESNTADVCGGGLYLNLCHHATLVEVTFRNNSQSEIWGRPCGGGGLCLDKSDATLTNVTFGGNTAQAGGGMYNWRSDATLINCTFHENSAARSGGGMLNVEGSNPELTNVTFSGNKATMCGGAMFNEESSSPALHNCILWGNEAPDGAQICNAGGTPDIGSSDIEGLGDSAAWDPSLGRDLGDNLGADPLFVDAATGDLHLRRSSPVVDAGDNYYVTVEVDLDGNPRIVNHQVDMGAYEFQWDD
jgi:hypothetical protein